MRVEKVTEPDRTLNVYLDMDELVEFLGREKLLIGPKYIPRDERFDVQFICIHLEDSKK